MGKETISYRMEKSALIYFVAEESITGSVRTIRPRFWQKIKLSFFEVEDRELHIITVMIPNLQKGWKRDKLLRLMQEKASECAMQFTDAEVVIQPAIQRILGQTDILPAVFWTLAEKLLVDKYPMKKATVKRRHSCLENLVLLLGNELFLEEQLQKFNEIIQPYFPSINHLTILYEIEENTDLTYDTDVTNTHIQQEDMNTDYEHLQNRWDEAIADYTEELYYEYGLVVQIQRGGDFHIKRNSRVSGQSAMLFLDLGYSGKLPLRAMQAGDIYLDVFSSAEKETLLKRKCSEISYLSPRKYLDTVVKSGYDN